MDQEGSEIQTHDKYAICKDLRFLASYFIQNPYIRTEKSYKGTPKGTKDY